MDVHPDLEPIAFLLGHWEGAGVIGYPTMESANFGQEIIFEHNGKPFLSYRSRTWLLDQQGQKVRPLASESGFWRVQPERQIEVMLAHPTGIIEIYVGEVVFHKIELITDVVARTVTSKDYSAGKRLYGLVNGNLMYAYEMAAVGHPLQDHASAELKKVAD
ncbi:FABP family protein [Herbidospora galbida]|uniref:Peroxynitrite isomerase n=1 Tax=Herbidospora galbida TaxID=2575442 RepID=A0A4U3MQ41_9ACTN|nr:FABP family protein [Herbidospora galbida]TKK90874.1 FABP family protein [Herbidospora galbida]